MGDPYLVARGTVETHFLGIGSDGGMYHFTWTPAGYSSLENLGGSFQTTAHGLSTDPRRLDILAVGTDSRLKQRALIGSTWGPTWNDLGGVFNSAPVAVMIQPGVVSVYGLGEDGALFHGTWTIGEDYSWTDGPNWLSDGGQFAPTYL